jgi:hypothetical protein
MKRLNKIFFLFLTISLLIGSLSSVGWAQDKPNNSRLNPPDLLIARPLGVVSAAIGTGIFIVALPFTLPTRSVNKSFDMFVVEPWKFSFVREFPDEQ